MNRIKFRQAQYEEKLEERRKEEEKKQHEEEEKEKRLEAIREKVSLTASRLHLLDKFSA